MQISSPLVYAAEKWANSGIKWPWQKNDAEPSLRVIEDASRRRRQPIVYAGWFRIRGNILK